MSPAKIRSSVVFPQPLGPTIERNSPEEIDRLIHEAETFAETDKNTKEMLVLRTKLDSLLKNTQKSFTKFGGLLPEIEHGFDTRQVFAPLLAAQLRPEGDVVFDGAPGHEVVALKDETHLARGARYLFPVVEDVAAGGRNESGEDSE